MIFNSVIKNFMEIEKEIKAKLEKLKELSPFHEDIAFLYQRFKEEYEKLKELPIDRATLERSLSSLKKRMDSMMEVVERYKARYEFFEKSGVNHLVFIAPKKEGISVKITKPEEIFPFSRIAHGRVLEFRDMAEVISGIANLKLGKIAVCKPIGYLRYKCVVDGKELILDYG